MKAAEIIFNVDNKNYVIDQIKQIVGEQYVLAGSTAVKEYRHDTSMVGKEPLAVVFPANSEEIKQIVLLANEVGLSLWPVSTGRNWGYGAACSLRENSIVLVLERLNRIISVDDKMAYALIEPGVTYAQLNQYLKDRKLKLWCDTTDGPPGGSVIGNALERGIGETPYGDHFGHLCGMEIVLPNGNVIETGGGRPQDLKSWNTYKYGVGPFIQGIFSQSNFGIVTKAGIWLMPEPEQLCSFTFELTHERDFPRLIETVRRLSLQGIIQTKLHIVNDIVGLSLLTQYSEEGLDTDTCISKETLQELREKYRVASWTFAGGIYGTKGRVKADKSVLHKELSALGKITFMGDTTVKAIEQLTNLSSSLKGRPLGTLLNAALELAFGKPLAALHMVPYIHAILKGNPTEYFVRHAYFRSSTKKPDRDVNPVRDGCGLIWFAPVAPLSAGNVDELLNICKPLFEQYGFDFYVALLLTDPRSVVVLFSILYAKENEWQARRAQELFSELCRATENAGYQQYRTNVAYMDRILDQSGDYKEFVSSLKQAIDANRVLAPGRYGIE